MATAAATTTLNTTDKKAIMRDKRAQGIVAMGLVNKQGDRFQVQTPSLRGRRASYEVWRDEAGRVRCSCLEFEEGAANDATFRCEHILAVKHSLVQRNTETAAAVNPVHAPLTLDAATPAPASAPDISVATTPTAQSSSPDNTNDSASEKPATRDVEEQSVVADFGRKQTETIAREEFDDEVIDETPLSETVRPVVRQLAPHTTDEDFTMKRHSAAALEIESPEIEDAAANAPAQIVSLGFANVLRALRQPVEPKLVKTREGWTDRTGNTHMVEYVEWHTVADILDRTYPTWSHAVRNITQIGDIVAVTAAITIDGVTREGVGTGTADNETGIKKAEHDALKRAAIKFGIARELYQRESEVIERTGSAPDAGEFPRDPLAKSMSDLVTPKQLGMIRALAREAGVDHEEECQAQLRCRTEELSKRAASTFIDHLKSVGGAAAASNTGMRRAS